MPSRRWTGEQLAKQLQKGSAKISKKSPAGIARPKQTAMQQPQYSTKAVDHLLWQISAYEFREPLREYRFDPVRKYRFDFAWPERKVAVEYEGGIHHGGSHTRGKRYQSDCRKYNLAVFHGWRLFRFTYDDVFDGYAILTLVAAFRNYPEQVACHNCGSVRCPPPKPALACCPECDHSEGMDPDLLLDKIWQLCKVDPAPNRALPEHHLGEIANLVRRYSKLQKASENPLDISAIRRVAEASGYES